MRRRRPSLLLATLLALSPAACSDAPFAPVGPLGGERYALMRVNGAPLPALLHGTAGGARRELVGETLEFRPFWRVRRTRVVRDVDAAGAATTQTIVRETQYRLVEPSEVSAAGIVLAVGSFTPCSSALADALSVACEPDERGVLHAGELQLSTVAYLTTPPAPLVLGFDRTHPRIDGEVERR